MAGELRRVQVNGPNAATREIHFRDGTSDYPCIEQVFQQQQYSTARFPRNAEIAEFLQRKRAEGARPLIIDAGANIGASAVFYAMIYPGAKIVAIEPEAENFALLRKNTDGLNVECLNAGLSSARGRLKIANPSSGNWAFRTEPSADEAGIPCVTIDAIYERECASAAVFPFIVKIDIEGSEADVFAQNTAWLDKTPILVIELHDWLFPKKGTASGFLQRIAGQPRDFISVGENVFSIAHELT